MTQQEDNKASVKRQFGQHAQNYVTSKVHAEGIDFDIMLEMAKPQAHHVVLDVATGGGHTALKFAPFVQQVIASDMTQQMLDVAEKFIAPQADNVVFRLAEAEKLPFDDASVDMITCRLAAHHFSDMYRFMLESARVLKPGGLLLIHDHLAPNDEKAANYLDSFERLRDPSHVKAYSEKEWRNSFLDAGFVVEDVNLSFFHQAAFTPWVERQNVPADAVERLEILLLQAPDAVQAWLEPKAIGTPDAFFIHRYIIIAGRKPESTE